MESRTYQKYQELQKLHYIMTTFPDNEETVTVGRVKFADDPGVENEVINLYPGVEYQTFEGFGGAFTDSAAYVYLLMDEAQKEELIRMYYGEDQMNYTLGRLHLDSCDFSLEQYEADSDPECREFWAEYLCRYIAELRAEGLNVCRMSVQNEPIAVQTWDSCIYSAQEEKEFLRDFLYPALQRAGLSDVEIFIWDHNKERAFERACEIIDADTDSMIAGIAFHWYSGDHFETLAMIRERFPGKKLVLSEACIEYYKFDAGDYLANAQKYAHDMTGNFNAGMTAFYDWNLLLDQRGGPNHVHNYCDAPYMYNTETGELEARNTLAYLRHFTRYIHPGAVRIGMSRYTTDLEVAAFRNPDGRIAAVILNRTRKEKPFVIRMNGMAAAHAIAPEAIMTVWVE